MRRSLGRLFSYKTKPSELTFTQVPGNKDLCRLFSSKSNNKPFEVNLTQIPDEYVRGKISVTSKDPEELKKTVTKLRDAGIPAIIKDRQILIWDNLQSFLDRVDDALKDKTSQPLPNVKTFTR